MLGLYWDFIGILGVILGSCKDIGGYIGVI